MSKLLIVLLAGLGIMGAMTEASAVAASVVPTGVMTDFNANGALTIAEVGGGLLTLAGIAVLFKWAKASFFG